MTTALPELKDKMTDCIAKVVGKNQLGRGYACSRYATSEPERDGKYAAYSRYTDSEDIEVKKPIVQKIRLSPTEPVPSKIDAATIHC